MNFEDHWRLALTADARRSAFAHDVALTVATWRLTCNHENQGDSAAGRRWLCRGALPRLEELLVPSRTREEALQNIREAVELYL
jgi:hypothetical protein